MRHSTFRHSLSALAGAAFLAAAWWAGSAIVGNPLLLPSPSEAIAALFRMAERPGFGSDLWATGVRVIVAFLLSYVAGLATGAASGLSKLLSAALSPLLAALRTVPFISISVLSIIWFSSGAVPVFVAFLMAFPIVASDIAEGIRTVDRDLIEMSEVYAVPKGRMLLKLYLPALSPHLFSAGAQALGMSWKIVVSAEVLSIPRFGIGGRMDAARAFLETDELFAWTLLLVALGYAADLILSAIMARSFRGRGAKP